MDQQDVKRAYMWVIIAGAVGAIVYSTLALPLRQLDTRFFALAILTVLLSSRLTVRIPRITGHISVSDTFLFLTILLYGGEAAVLLAAAEALCSSLRFSYKPIHIKPITVAFNSAMMACSTFVTFVSVQLLFGNVSELRRGQFSAR